MVWAAARLSGWRRRIPAGCLASCMVFAESMTEAIPTPAWWSGPTAVSTVRLMAVVVEVVKEGAARFSI